MHIRMRRNTHKQNGTIIYEALSKLQHQNSFNKPLWLAMGTLVICRQEAYAWLYDKISTNSASNQLSFESRCLLWDKIIWNDPRGLLYMHHLKSDWNTRIKLFWNRCKYSDYFFSFKIPPETITLSPGKQRVVDLSPSHGVDSCMRNERWFSIPCEARFLSSWRFRNYQLVFFSHMKMEFGLFLLSHGTSDKLPPH